MKYKLLALASLLCMAPNYYLPLVGRSCPNPYVYSMTTNTAGGPHSIFHYYAEILYAEGNPLVSILPYDYETGQSLEPYLVPNWEENTTQSGVQKAFSILNYCEATGFPYKVRFDLIYQGGCTASIVGEFIPLEIYGEEECN